MLCSGATGGVKKCATEMSEFQQWWIGIILLILAVIPEIHGWGDEGHYSVCKIAESYLSEEAAAAVKRLVPSPGELADVCSWPDEIKRNPAYRWSSALHFADTPQFKCNYNYCRDCHDSAGNKDRCVTAAIYNYTAQLVEGHRQSVFSPPKYNLSEALMFLSHFIGDLHQPLHLGFTEDLGGNRIMVQWYETTTNLHRVWDDMIIESALEKFYSKDVAIMIQAIQKNISNAIIDDTSSDNCTGTVCPDPYASESVSLACKFAYPNATPGSTLGDDYFYSRWPVVEKRLAQGGVRLAALLNRIFSKTERTTRASI